MKYEINQKDALGCAIGAANSIAKAYEQKVFLLQQQNAELSAQLAEAIRCCNLRNDELKESDEHLEAVRGELGVANNARIEWRKTFDLMHQRAMKAERQLESAQSKLAELERQEPIGSVTIQRWRGIDSMINTDFVCADKMPDGTYDCYAKPSAPAQLNENREPEAGQEPIKISAAVKKFLRDSINEATQCDESDIDYEFAECLAQFLKPLYVEPVTANKAEVHEFALECAKSYKQHYSKWESAKDSESKIYHEGCLRVAHHLFEVTTHLHGYCNINSIPPLKDGE